MARGNGKQTFALTKFDGLNAGQDPDNIPAAAFSEFHNCELTLDEKIRRRLGHSVTYPLGTGRIDGIMEWESPDGIHYIFKIEDKKLYVLNETTWTLFDDSILDIDETKPVNWHIRNGFLYFGNNTLYKITYRNYFGPVSGITTTGFSIYDFETDAQITSLFADYGLPSFSVAPAGVIFDQVTQTLFTVELTKTNPSSLVLKLFFNKKIQFDKTISYPGETSGDVYLFQDDLFFYVAYRTTTTRSGTWYPTAGAWGPANTPTLADGVGVKGTFYVIGSPGTLNLGGGTQTFVGSNYIMYDGARWMQISNTYGYYGIATMCQNYRLTKINKTNFNETTVLMTRSFCDLTSGHFNFLDGNVFFQKPNPGSTKTTDFQYYNIDSGNITIITNQPFYFTGSLPFIYGMIPFVAYTKSNITNIFIIIRRYYGHLTNTPTQALFSAGKTPTAWAVCASEPSAAAMAVPLADYIDCSECTSILNPSDIISSSAYLNSFYLQTAPSGNNNLRSFNSSTAYRLIPTLSCIVFSSVAAKSLCLSHYKDISGLKTVAGGATIDTIALSDNNSIPQYSKIYSNSGAGTDFRRGVFIDFITAQTIPTRIAMQSTGASAYCVEIYIPQNAWSKKMRYLRLGGGKPINESLMNVALFKISAHIVETHQSSLFFLEETESNSNGSFQTLYWTEPYFDSLAETNDTFLYPDKKLIGLLSIQGRLILMYRDFIVAIDGVINSQNYSVSTIYDKGGCVSHNTIKKIQNSAFWLGEQGIFAFEGGYVRLLSERIKNIIKTINKEYIHKSFAVIDLDQNKYKLWVPTRSATEVNLCIVYNYLTKTFSTEDLSGMIPTALAYINDDEGYGQLLIGLSDGAILKANDGWADRGLPIEFDAQSPDLKYGDPFTQHVTKALTLHGKQHSEVLLTYRTDGKAWFGSVAGQHGQPYKINNTIRVMNGQGLSFQWRIHGRDAREPWQIDGILIEYYPTQMRGMQYGH